MRYRCHMNVLIPPSHISLTRKNLIRHVQLITRLQLLEFCKVTKRSRSSLLNRQTKLIKKLTVNRRNALVLMNRRHRLFRGNTILHPTKVVMQNCPIVIPRVVLLVKRHLSTRFWRLQVRIRRPYLRVIIALTRLHGPTRKESLLAS